ncbi:MAG: hypothetical protein DRJ15_08730 [Bacteroidetes bacterium]|nr:MAG: hypothetical protein DRJ15_08730 [Bacteroidota bacterium]
MKLPRQNEVYGSNDRDGDIFINVPLIWKDSLDENTFMRNFGLVNHHEVLHVEIYRVYESLDLQDFCENFLVKEESIVRDLTATVMEVL